MLKHKSIQESYNQWASGYDTQENSTRDLAHQALISHLGLFKNADVLDVGCGTGTNLETLSKTARSVTGMDFSTQMLEKAKQKPLPTHVWLVQHNILDPWPFKDQYFDAISMMLVLEHIEELLPIFQESYRALKNNGFMFICEYHPERQLAGKAPKYYDHGEAVHKSIPSYHHTMEEFSDAAANAGFQIMSAKEWSDPQSSNPDPQILSLVLNKKNQ